MLPALLNQFDTQRGVELERLVCDGGSDDATPAQAAAAGASLITSAAGRGRQMNAGAGAAKHPWLLFLHADSRLTHPHQLAAGVALLERQSSRRCAGHFRLRFDDPPSGHGRLFAHMERKSALNRPFTVNGDQGLLLHRDFFAELGGFDESLPILEDQRIGRRIAARGEWRLLPHALATSARRFAQEGAGARYFVMMLIMCAEHAGIDQFFDQPVYRRQDRTGRLAVSPSLEVMLNLGEARPDFWPRMAAYSLDNAWQLFFALDGLPGGGRWLTAYERLLERRLPRRLLVPLLAPLLRALFHGPVLAYWRRRDQKV